MQIHGLPFKGFSSEYSECGLVRLYFKQSLPDNFVVLSG